MLTGDKGETARTIGISCGLIDDKQDQVFCVESSTKADLYKDIQIIKDKLESMGLGASVIGGSPDKTEVARLGSLEGL